jgi:hypothetical protein
MKLHCGMLTRCFAFSVLIAFAGACWAGAKNSCFVFRLKGDVIVVCGGRTQITHRGDIEELAVSEEHAVLGFVSARAVGTIPGGTISAYTATIVDLRSGRTKSLEITRPHIVSTCGAFSSWMVLKAFQRTGT